MNKTSINPPSLFDSQSAGFSQVVSCEPGKLIFVSGQTAWDKDRQIAGKDDLEIQALKSIQNLSIALDAAGASLQDVVMLRIYVVDLPSASTKIISDQLKQHFGDHLPASTWLSVAGLAHPDFLIEIEAQAVITSQ